MLDFIVKYWVQELFALLLSMMAYILKRIHAWKAEQESVKDGVLAILHDRLYQACQYYLKKGYCTVEDRDNLEYMFRPYKALGGNGTGEELYKRCMALPYRPASEMED